MNEDVAKVMVAVKERIEKLEALLLGLEWLGEPSGRAGNNGQELQAEDEYRAKRMAAADGTERTKLVRMGDELRKGKVRQKLTKETKKAKTRNTRPGAVVSKRDPRLIAVAQGLGASFRARELGKAAGLEWKQASNVITGWLQWGWLKRVGHGQYERTKRFGAGPHAGPSRTGLAKPTASAPGGEVSAESERLRREIHEEIKAGKSED